MRNRRKTMLLLACAFVILIFAACDDNLDEVLLENQQDENSEDHGNTGDYIWDNSDATQVVLNGSSVTVDGTGATVDGSIVTIISAGAYDIVGSLSDGQIVVDTKDEEAVRLILGGVSIRSSTSSPINVVNAQQTVIVLADNTENYVADGASYIFEDPAEDEPNATIFSKDDLTIEGNGSLAVDGNYNDGISSKDGLTISGGIIAINSVDDGIRGKDYLTIKDANITVNAEGDGLKSDEDEDASKGFISIENCIINITAGGDAITAETDVVITSGEYILSTGGGSSRSTGDTSAKGIKAVVSLVIDDGTITIDSADDAIHSNGVLAINGGNLAISSGDDGIHADSDLEVNGGEIYVAKSYEGIESRSVISINNGDIHIVSSDDGLNVAGGNDGSGMNEWPRDPGQRPPGMGGFPDVGDYHLYIKGGYIVIDANGDGIDSNGSVVMTDGDVIVHGPTENMNGALDHVSFKITGGFLVAAGSSGMAQAPDMSSTQYSLLLNLNSQQQAGTLFHIQTSEGDEILSFAPVKRYQSIAFSSPELIKGSTYDVYYGGSSTGIVVDGLYADGNYTPGTKYTDFTISSIVTSIDGTGRPGDRPNMPF
jgi:hypothetical protein